MSLLSRLFGKSPPATVAPTTPVPVAPAPPPRPDPAARAREEDVSLAQSLASGDMAAVGKWVTEGSTTQVRQRAAQAITDPEQLRELIRATKGGKDKSVYRILTTKRDVQLAETRRADQLRAEVEQAAQAIARHAERTYDASYAATLAQLESRWEKVAGHATEELRAEVSAQLARARDAIEQHRRAQEAEAERQRAAAQAAAEARQQRELELQAERSAAEERTHAQEAERLAERQAAQAKREADAAAVRELVKLLRQAEAALERGGTARATRMRAEIAEQLPQAPALPGWYAAQLERLDSRIAELKDWKTFTVVPKRGELLQQMQALVGAEVSPEELAERIRRLRAEWRTLHRGAGDDPSPEMEQFEEAAKRAFEPCREHFAKQAAVRKENQARREALLERLAAFVAEQSGENPDWRAVRRVLAEARREWREYAPVDQSVVKSLQARFHELIGGLQKRLDAEFARNLEARRALVARAAELATAGDARAATDEVKRLQQDWKSVGPVPRTEDDALWEEFRRHCDAVFQRSAQESATQAAAAEAERRASEVQRRERADAARRGWSDLFAAAGRVREYALATALGRPADEREPLGTAAASALADLEHAPKPARAVLEQQMTRVASGDVSADLAANEAALRLLCVRAELMADLESPLADVPLRREYQMKRLVESMGQGGRVTPAQFDDLTLEWLAAGPVETAVYEPLLARLVRCRGVRAPSSPR
ncbi:MAG: DUF349 domain-containing protein [Gammaproteobacteria bacterium]|nr:DUF349 domain-containing protein [Gammaproteobacteria bacterium]